MGLIESCCADPSGSNNVTVNDLLIIKNHPNRVRRKSSAVPNRPKIPESRILEEMSELTGIEPDVPADSMRSSDVSRLVRRLSTFDPQKPEVVETKSRTSSLMLSSKSSSLLKLNEKDKQILNNRLQEIYESIEDDSR